MRRDQLLAIVGMHEPQLRAEHGVKTLTLFGSVARDEAKLNSDVDLLVEFDRPTGYFGLVRLQLFLEKLLGSPVDLGTPGSLKPSMRQRIEQESLRVA
jgi:predicted nucleotidyltransferase